MLTRTSIHAALSGSTICSAAGQVAIGHTPVLALCRQLIAAGFAPATPVEVYRGNTLALRVRTIGEAARLRVGSHGVGFEALPECTAGPLVRRTRRAAP